MRTLAATALLLVVALVVGILLGAGPLSHVVSREPPTASPTPTHRPTPSPTPVDPAIVASARVVPLRSAELAAPVNGRVATVFVEEDEDVAAGQLLLRLDDSGYRASVEVARADMRRAEALVERARVELELLPEDTSEAERESAQADLRLAQAELDLARTALAEAEVALGQSELRAPFSGTVVAVEVTEGEQAVAGETLLTMADMSAWLVETTDLGELEVVRVAVGDRATIEIEALRDLSLSGTVERIQVRGVGRQEEVRFDVVIRPDRHVARLRWNMSATVRIRAGT